MVRLCVVAFFLVWFELQPTLSLAATANQGLDFLVGVGLITGGDIIDPTPLSEGSSGGMDSAFQPKRGRVR